MQQTLAHLKNKGFKPQTVIDIGVAYGTFELYEAFPNAKHILIEPLGEFMPNIQKIMQKYNCEYIQTAAGPRNGTVEINVKRKITGSSFYKEKIGNQSVARTVRMLSLDNIFSGKSLNDPILLKIDAEGAELDVLSGAIKILDKTDVIILEVTFYSKLNNAPEFTEVVTYMDEKGYVTYDIFNLRTRVENGILSQADIVFVKKDGRFRKDCSLT
jgi:FkbM family methyltransferase